MKSKIFIIEHLEPEIWPWCIIEYINISKIVGKKNLWFTNIKDPNSKEAKKLKKSGKIIQESVKNLNLRASCILDPESQTTLTPEIANDFRYFIFGGILGDNPPKKRTEEELSQFFQDLPKYNIGKEQMSTDNAVCVVKKITNGIPLSKMNFQDSIEIKINKIESTILPYKYLLINKKPFISKDLIKFLKKQ